VPEEWWSQRLLTGIIDIMAIVIIIVIIIISTIISTISTIIIIIIITIIISVIIPTAPHRSTVFVDWGSTR
jgi:hypothetical protein